MRSSSRNSGSPARGRKATCSPSSVLDVYKPKKRDEYIARSLARENSRIAAIAAEASTEMRKRDERMLAQVQLWTAQREQIETGYMSLQNQYCELQEHKVSEENRAAHYEANAQALFQAK